MAAPANAIVTATRIINAHRKKTNAVSKVIDADGQEHAGNPVAIGK